ncbi:MAG: glycoside hydrolase family 127 protein [Anaerolineales bacterium]|nr:glycoside hydrolase family 127 protein [Anaerolineales bacterium]
MHTATYASPHARLRALPFAAARLTGGFWAERQAVNRAAGLRHGYAQLEQAGNFYNLRLAAGLTTGDYKGYLYLDSDLYKWLEAVSYALAAGPDPELQALADRTIGLLAAAQQGDGYLNAYWQVAKPGQRWTDLDHGHEMYCAGHLFQAAVAHHRATGRPDLLTLACKFADHIDATFGPGKRQGACGHPEVELALVELYRETGERRYLALAAYLLDWRGHRHFRAFGSFGPEYYQDHAPVRDFSEVVGHVVRQFYLDVGVVDLYLETGEPALLAAAQRRWHDATAHKMHVTGGFGARYEGEAFGLPYELPSDRTYCETCAAIGGMMLNWRLLLATGEARYAELFERGLYNGFLAGPALDGRSYFYVNPLQSRGGYARSAWYATACCPPNVMRTLASVEHFLATTSAAGVQVHQYAAAEITLGPRALRLDTHYPWDGDITLTVTATDAAEWELQLRIPTWAAGATATLNGAPLAAALTPGAYAAVTRAWQVGDVIQLRLPLTPRFTQPHPRIDALRGTLALERGPLVYCLEQGDQPAGVDLLDVQVDLAAQPQTTARADLPGVVALAAPGYRLNVAALAETLYYPADAAPQPRAPLTLTAVPYYAWANRGAGAMRVWLPAA